MGTSNCIGANNEGVVYYNGSGTFSGIDGSTASYVLTSNGSNVAPSFQPAGGGISGGWVLIETKDVAGLSNVDFTYGITSTYQTYALIINPFVTNVGSSVDAGSSLYMRFSNDGGASFISTATYRTVGSSNPTTSAKIYSGTIANAQISACVFIYGMARPMMPNAASYCSSIYSGGYSAQSNGGGNYSIGNANAFRLFVTNFGTGVSGIFVSGSMSLYGIAS